MAKTTKGERTRAAILKSALDLFYERGYEETTMRAVAAEAGVSLGNAYYYFKSKEHLIQAYYEGSHQRHAAACVEVLEKERGFQKRLEGVLRAQIDVSMPYQQFAGGLFRVAADPRSPLNPFSAESRPVREESTKIFAEVLEGSDTRVADALAAELPELLWLYHMGIILFWIFDDSEGCRRTYRLIERTVELVARLVSLANFAPMRPLVRSGIALLKDLKDEDGNESSSSAVDSQN